MPYHVLEPFRSVITDCKCPHYATLFAINAVFEHFSTLFEFEEYENTLNYAFFGKNICFPDRHRPHPDAKIA